MPRWLDRVASLGRGFEALSAEIEIIAREQERIARPADVVFALRDLPWREPSRTDDTTALLEWCGRGSLKHRLLAVAMEAAGLDVRLIMASYRLNSETPWLPKQCTVPVGNQTMTDIWSFVLVDFGHGLAPLDITFPAGLLGPKVPVLGSSLKLGALPIEPLELFQVSPDEGGDAERDVWRRELAGEDLPRLISIQEALDAEMEASSPQRSMRDGIANTLSKWRPDALFKQ